jgi:hypothetical protein
VRTRGFSRPSKENRPDTEVELTGRRLAASVGCALLVLGAVALELLSGQAANSPDDAVLQPFVPLSWPQPARVLWWLTIAGAAACHRLFLDTGTGLRRQLVALAAAAPFAVFAAGIAFSTGWSAWH